MAQIINIQLTEKTLKAKLARVGKTYAASKYLNSRKGYNFGQKEFGEKTRTDGKNSIARNESHHSQYTIL